MRYLAMVAGLVLAACGSPGLDAVEPLSTAAPTASAAAASDAVGLAAAREQAAAGVDDRQLAELLREHWLWTLKSDPLHATRLGVHAYDDQLADDSRAGIDRTRAERDRFLQRALALQTTPKGTRDAMTLALLIEELRAWQASDVCSFELWSLSPRINHITRWNHLREEHKVETPQDGNNLVARYRAIPRSIDNEIALLRVGAAQGLVATRETIRRIVDQVDQQLAQPIEAWPMFEPAQAAHDDWSAHELAAFREGLRAAVVQGIKPALTRWGALLQRELLPKGRSDAESGLGALPNGKACYQARILAFTTVELSAQEIHAIGLQEIEALDAAFVELGDKALGSKTLADTLAKLRSDTALYFTSEQEIERAAQQVLAEAKAKIPQYFGILPKADCVVRRVPDYEAPYTTIAYYRPPHADGSKPGEYFVNVLNPSARPRFEARVLALHEAIPGHHLQIAIAQELPSVPAFRKHGGFTAYIEGWALYTERLGVEMGMYPTDLDRLGMLSFDAWRAGRLVVDTGVHAMGWSRARARAYLEAHTALAPKNIDNEVDRYISWPGQALAYKLGQREIAALRAEAEDKLGDRFSLPAFHDAVLSLGAVSLPVLRSAIRAYIDTQLRQAPSAQ